MDGKKKKKELIRDIKGEQFLIRPIRTYEDDVAGLVKRKKISTAKIVMAEQKRRLESSSGKTKEVNGLIVPDRNIKGRKKRNSKINSRQVEDVEKKLLGFTNQKNTTNETKKETKLPIKAILSIILVLLGIGLIVGVIIFTDIDERLGEITPISKGDGSEKFISEDSKIAISVDNRSAREIRKIIQERMSKNDGLDLKEISEIKIQKRVISEIDGSSGTQDISTAEFFRILESSAPSELVRTLSRDFMLGMINIGEIKPFILFRTTDIDQSYASMFDWEPVMYRDINDIFYQTLGLEDFYKKNIDDGVSDMIVPTFDPRVFKDEIMINRDTRAIVDSSGDILFFYSFIDSEHLLMASDIEVLREIIQRLNVQRLIR